MTDIPVLYRTYIRDKRREAVARYREDVRNATEQYHYRVGSIWRAHGKPSTSAECARTLRAAWSVFVCDLKLASFKLEQHNQRLAFINEG